MVVPAFVKFESLWKVDLRNVVFAPLLFPVFPEYIPGVKWIVPPVPFLAAVRTRQTQCKWMVQHYRGPRCNTKGFCFHLFLCRTFIMVACNCNSKGTRLLSTQQKRAILYSGIFSLSMKIHYMVHTKKKVIYMYCQVLYIAKTANPKNKMKLLNHLITHLQFLSRIPFEN